MATIMIAANPLFAPARRNEMDRLRQETSHPGARTNHSRSNSSRRIILGMPEEETLERARKDEEEGKAPSTQAGEFVREEMDHIREGKHGAASTKQAIAMGLSKARRRSEVAAAEEGQNGCGREETRETRYQKRTESRN
jgi:hypothetical protein